MIDNTIDRIVSAVLVGRQDKIFSVGRSEADKQHFQQAGLSLLRHFYEKNPQLDAEILQIASQVLDE